MTDDLLNRLTKLFWGRPAKEGDEDRVFNAVKDLTHLTDELGEQLYGWASWRGMPDEDIDACS